MSKTDNQATYTATAIRETQINPWMVKEHKSKQKKFEAVSLSYAPLPADGQVVLKYKIDGGSYTTIFTETTDSALKTIRTINDSGGAVISDGREVEFRIESTGGVEITELAYDYVLIEEAI